MGQPTAAAVPIASWIGTLRFTRNGTTIDAPPVAVRLEMKPMKAPKPDMTAAFGSAPVGRASCVRTIWNAK